MSSNSPDSEANWYSIRPTDRISWTQAPTYQQSFWPVEGIPPESDADEQTRFTTLRTSSRQLTTDEKVALRKLIPFIVEMRKIVNENGTLDQVVDSFFKHANEERPDPVSLVSRVATGVLTEIYPDFKSEIDEEVGKKRAEDQARIDNETAELKVKAEMLAHLNYVQKKRTLSGTGTRHQEQSEKISQESEEAILDSLDDIIRILSAEDKS